MDIVRELEDLKENMEQISFLAAGNGTGLERIKDQIRSDWLRKAGSSPIEKLAGFRFFYDKAKSRNTLWPILCFFISSFCFLMFLLPSTPGKISAALIFSIIISLFALISRLDWILVALVKFLVYKLHKTLIKVKSKKDEQNLLAANFQRLDSDPMFLIDESEKLMEKLLGSFQKRFFGLEAEFKSAISQPRIKAESAIIRLRVLKTKVQDGQFIGDRAKIIREIEQRIRELEQKVSELAPEEERTIYEFREVGQQLGNLRGQIATLEEIKLSCQSTEQIIIELTELQVGSNDDLTDTAIAEVQVKLSQLSNEVAMVISAIDAIILALPAGDNGALLARVKNKRPLTLISPLV